MGSDDELYHVEPNEPDPPPPVPRCSVCGQELPDGFSFHMHSYATRWVPVIDGWATLGDGRRVQAAPGMGFVSYPVLLLNGEELPTTKRPWEAAP